MDILAGLNPQQRLAVEHGRGPALVLAGAGSGKTRVIAHRIAYLIRNSAARPENILAVTFTNKAAKEMQERVGKTLGSSRGSEPLISTFHSFCVRLLRREIHHLGYRRDFSIYDADDQRRLVKQILEEDGGPEIAITPREVLSRISYAKNHGVAPWQYASRFPSKKADTVQQVFLKYNKRLRHLNALDFDDLLLNAVAVLQKMPESRRYYSDWYRYILVDEYQDTNRPQYELLRLLTATHANLFVVGDEDQSIYKFRGADVQNILRFENDFPGAKVFKLEENYRSSGNILRVAGAVVQNNTERKGKTLWTKNAGGDTVTCYCARTPREEAEWAAERIKSALDEHPGGRIAVLYRVNFLSRNFEEVLAEKGIPYALVGSVAFFGRMEVKDLLAYLRIIYNPEDDAALLRIINTPARGIGATTIERLTAAALEKGAPLLQTARAMSRDPQLPGRAHRPVLQFLELIDKWARLQETAAVGELLDVVLKDTKYIEELRRRESAEEANNRIANIEELIRAAAESEARGETISEFLDRAALSSELDHLDPNAGVSLMTLHSAKGLEFDTVFLAGMEEGLVPHSQSTGSPEDLEEERRLCYVGITRAKQKLYLTWSHFRKSYGADAGSPSPVSRFLDEMPPELLEGLDQAEFHDSYWRTPFGGRTYERAAAYRAAPQRPVGRARVRDKGLQAPKSIAELKAYVERQNRKAEASKTDSGGGVFKAGARVRHELFGDGIILTREQWGHEIKLTVSFSRAGRKSLIERFAKLKVL